MTHPMNGIPQRTKQDAPPYRTFKELFEQGQAIARAEMRKPPLKVHPGPSTKPTVPGEK